MTAINKEQFAKLLELAAEMTEAVSELAIHTNQALGTHYVARFGLRLKQILKDSEPKASDPFPFEPNKPIGPTIPRPVPLVDPKNPMDAIMKEWEKRQREVKDRAVPWPFPNKLPWQDQIVSSSPMPGDVIFNGPSSIAPTELPDMDADLLRSSYEITAAAGLARRNFQKT